MRPYIIRHTGTSIDGRPRPGRFTAAAADVSPDILRGHHERVVERFGAGGWIVGRETMAEMAEGRQKSIADAPKLPREARIGNRAGRFSPVVEAPKRTDGTTGDGSAFRGKVTFVAGGGPVPDGRPHWPSHGEASDDLPTSLRHSWRNRPVPRPDDRCTRPLGDGRGHAERGRRLTVAPAP